MSYSFPHMSSASLSNGLATALHLALPYIRTTVVHPACCSAMQVGIPCSSETLGTISLVLSLCYYFINLHSLNRLKIQPLVKMHTLFWVGPEDILYSNPCLCLLGGWVSTRSCLDVTSSVFHRFHWLRSQGSWKCEVPFMFFCYKSHHIKCEYPTRSSRICVPWHSSSSDINTNAHWTFVKLYFKTEV
jgi:hypothetical protein